ncbi:formyltransferase [Sulfuriferula sp. AH1]|uniref:formyltransferase n=1 Tax=Sulfuriferula sp. AH1 TaxID=1985873 RepID=UPI000B3B5AFE|nr:formyltransferase [Sulfuriferula sp. AH1]ARU31453.1 formyltransferase [Sulfuriferula sp. AH1]
MTRAVVFAYHDVGVRCLSVLLDAGIEIALVVTHEDAQGELIWFDSVAELAARYDIPVITPDDPNVPEIVAQIAALAPDFIFSFYYKLMIKAPLLAIPARGALNMHGSLLPEYRGRVPVNWAIIHGETQTGATLHYMTEKPDAGAIVEQTAVPILTDDTAGDVFRKVTCAAEITLHRALPSLVAGTAVAKPQDLSKGGYFGGRRPEHGKIDWSQSANAIHNLIRAVAPPYPGAYTTLLDKPLRVLRSRVIDQASNNDANSVFFCDNHGCYVHCSGGGTLQLLALEWDGKAVSSAEYLATFGNKALQIN